MNGQAMVNRTARSLALLVLALLPASACDVLTPTDAPTDSPEAIHDNATATTDEGSATADEVPPTATEVPATEVETLFASAASGVMSSRRQVIRSETELADAWAEVTGLLVSAEPAPDIDFSAGQVLLVAMGERPSGGYGIDVTSVAEESGTLYAVVDEVSPGADCLTTAALTQPVLVLRVPATEGDVSFVEQESVLDCS